MTSTLPGGVLAKLKERWEERPDYSADPVGWADARAIELWSKQRETLQALVDYSQVAVKSCHSAGKSFNAAEAVAWWIDSHPPGEAVAVTSAPTATQVKAILWKEVNRVHKAQGLRGRTNLTEWYDEAGELVAFGRKPNDYEPTAFQGIHARYVLVVLDEACGIPESLWEAASSLASNEHGRILAIGNPDDPQSHFAKVCESDAWHTIRISAYDTPNFTDEPVSQRLSELLVSRRWVEEKAVEWGETSGVFQSKVLGLFPTDSEDGVVPFSWASRCRTLELPAGGESELGFDVSGGGADRSVIWWRRGDRAVKKFMKQGEKDPLKLAEWVLGVIQQTGAAAVKIDATGVGWGVGGIIDGWYAEGRHECQVVPVMSSEQADDDDQFLNKRAEMWWHARELCRTEAWDLEALDDDDVAELTTPRWHTSNKRQRTQIESKDEIRKRLKKSPDSADALLLAFHVEVFASESLIGAMTGRR